MGEYNITKIIDGLFISDSLVPEVNHLLFRIPLLWLATKSLGCLDGQVNQSIINLKMKVFLSSVCLKV